MIAELRCETTQEIGKRVFVVGILLLFLVGASFATVYNSSLIGTSGTIGYSSESYLDAFHTGRGILGITGGSYNRTHVLFARMQLSAEINNSATEPSEILVPSGGYYDTFGHMTITDNSWSEGGVNFENLKRNLAYCWDNGYVPVLALWITNIDPLEDRYYVTSNMEQDIPAQPMANLTGYKKFFNYLKTWMSSAGYSDKMIIWEPCWEFNLYPWTNWGGAGIGRNWRIHPSSYENAMTMIMEAKSVVGFDNVKVAAHIIPWSADEWLKRGKLRINGTSGGEETAGYLNGMKQVDVWGISLYGEWNISWNDNDVVALGAHGYIDWLFEKIVKQCAEDSDMGEKFIGTFEYNMPWQILEMRDDILTDYTKAQLEEMAIDYINYTYSKIPQFFDYIRMLEWWCPFVSDAQWNAWRYWTAQYDGWKP